MRSDKCLFSIGSTTTLIKIHATIILHGLSILNYIQKPYSIPCNIENSVIVVLKIGQFKESNTKFFQKLIYNCGKID